MTFEYRDSTGASLTVATTSIGISLWTQPEDVAIAHDRVEEVIAGIRDTARTAIGQVTCGCGEPTTPGVVHRPDAPCYVLEQGPEVGTWPET